MGNEASALLVEQKPTDMTVIAIYTDAPMILNYHTLAAGWAASRWGDKFLILMADIVLEVLKECKASSAS